jgi:hypothetical protein
LNCFIRPSLRSDRRSEPNPRFLAAPGRRGTG